MIVLPFTAPRRRPGVPRGLVPLARRGPGMARDIPVKRRDGHAPVSVNLIFTSFAKQARRSRKGGFTACANVFSPIPVTP